MLVFFAKDVVDFIERIDVRGLRHCTLLGQSRCVTARLAIGRPCPSPRFPRWKCCRP
ncbi:hypothetical protein MPL3356_150250 [Mesorhizobium plurifarium]|uniref:Uncharacterized protein n=1 Tax=Mesorhizobium plurifarium TaxID=69974 RepID=A0A090F4L5_MESPL|nr:hypothetical protein MPL3356_150250 [Mesorhizobium plurifarium]CDX51500.1 hypothetical protein MPL3365_130494 [Mesorhizobium plurifarium]CDX60276.1 hypothetical protein MPL1032_30144 [Mesorhizobium plurifarium]